MINLNILIFYVAVFNQDMRRESLEESNHSLFESYFSLTARVVTLYARSLTELSARESFPVFAATSFLSDLGTRPNFGAIAALACVRRACVAKQSKMRHRPRRRRRSFHSLVSLAEKNARRLRQRGCAAMNQIAPLLTRRANAPVSARRCNPRNTHAARSAFGFLGGRAER